MPTRSPSIAPTTSRSRSSTRKKAQPKAKVRAATAPTAKAPAPVTPPSPALQTGVRVRVQELRWVTASELVPNPRNYKHHGIAQRQLFRSLLARYGFAGAELTRTLPDGRLMLVDGHLRRDQLGEQAIPCLVTDLDEREADALLASFDPVGHLAGVENEAVVALMQSLQRQGERATAGLLAASALADPTQALLKELATKPEVAALVNTASPIGSATADTAGSPAMTTGSVGANSRFLGEDLTPLDEPTVRAVYEDGGAPGDAPGAGNAPAARERPERSDEIPGLDDTGRTYRNQYAVAVLCADEAEQRRVYNDLSGQGFSCKVLVV